MSRQDYWVAVHEERDVEWCCPSCAPPQFESTRIEDPFKKDVAIPSLPLPDVFTPPLFESPHQESSQADLPVGTIRGKTKLVMNTRYTFNIRKRRTNGTGDWQCTVHHKDLRCKASVTQCDDAFHPGLHPHNHPGEVGSLTATKIQSRVIQTCHSILFASCRKKKIDGLGRKKKKNKKSYCHMPYLSFIITNKPTNCIVSFYHKWHAKTYLNQHPPSSTRCYLTKSRTTTPVQRSQNLKTWLAQPAQTRRSYRPAVQTFQRKWVNSSA